MAHGRPVFVAVAHESTPSPRDRLPPQACRIRRNRIEDVPCRGFFAQNKIVERGGELIDTDHTAVQGLAAELGLPLDDLHLAEAAGTQPFYQFLGKAYSYTQILKRFQAIYPALISDLNAVGDVDYTKSTRRGKQLDHTNVAEYIEQLTEPNEDEILAGLLNVAYTEEFGAETNQQTAITTLGMGANAKLQLQFRSRHWNTLGNNGDTFSDTGYQNTWESTRAQAGSNGILVNFTGGNTTLEYSTDTMNQIVSEALSSLEPVLPGLSSKYNGLSTLDNWPGNPWSRGSYAYWKVGQYTTIAGSEGVREGNVHFCGEHTSFDYQGYLNGAVDSGNTAAAEVIADLS